MRTLGTRRATESQGARTLTLRSLTESSFAISNVLSVLANIS